MNPSLSLRPNQRVERKDAICYLFPFRTGPRVKWVKRCLLSRDMAIALRIYRDRGAELPGPHPDRIEDKNARRQIRA